MKRFFTLLLTALCAVAGMQAWAELNLDPNTKFYLGVTSLTANGQDAGAITMTVDDTYVATFRLPSSSEPLNGNGVRADIALQGVWSLGITGTKSISKSVMVGLNSTQDITNPNGTIGAYFVNAYNFQGVQLAATIDGIPTTYNVSAATREGNSFANPTYIVAAPASFESTERAWHDLVSHVSMGQNTVGANFIKVADGSYLKNGDAYLHLTPADGGDLVLQMDSMAQMDSLLGVIQSRVGFDSISGQMIDVVMKKGCQIGMGNTMMTLTSDCKVTCPDFIVACLGYNNVAALLAQMQSMIAEGNTGNAIYAAIFKFFEAFNTIVGEVDQADTITINIDFFPPVKMITPADSTIAAAMPQDASAEAQAAVKAVFKNAAVTGMTDAETGLASAVSVAGDYLYVNIELNAANADDNNVVDSMAFEVKPTAVIYNNGIKSVVTIPNSAITGAITFRLPIDKNVDSAYVNVYHQADANSEKTSLGQYTIQVDADGNKYIEISTSSFSIFSYAVPQPKQTPLEPTSLDSLTSTSVESGVYSLDGKKLNAVPASGLYIKDGRVQFAK